MVFALVGDSTTTRAAVPAPSPAAVAFARDRRLGGGAAGGFTSRFLAATHQPRINSRRASLPSSGALRKSHDLRGDFGRGLAISLYLFVRLEIRRFPLLEQLAHLLHRILSH